MNECKGIYSRSGGVNGCLFNVFVWRNDEKTARTHVKIWKANGVHGIDVGIACVC